jgi:hypothetical protein
MITVKVLRSVILGGLIVGVAGALSPRAPAPDTPTAFLGDLRVQAHNSPDGATLELANTRYHCALGRARIEHAAVKQILLSPLGGKTCVAVLLEGPQDAVRLYDVGRRGLDEMWRGISASLNPWKIAFVDVDGDGAEEIAVGVYKKARFHPVMANRLFIFGWDGQDVYPRWMGSRLSRPFSDFAFADFGGGTKLIAIEETRDGGDELGIYVWDDFGFAAEGRGARADRMSDLGVQGAPGEQYISVRCGRERRAYVWNGTALRPREDAP